MCLIILGESGNIRLSTYFKRRKYAAYKQVRIDRIDRHYDVVLKESYNVTFVPNEKFTRKLFLVFIWLFYTTLRSKINISTSNVETANYNF